VKKQNKQDFSNIKKGLVKFNGAVSLIDLFFKIEGQGFPKCLFCQTLWGLQAYLADFLTILYDRFVRSGNLSEK